MSRTRTIFILGASAPAAVAITLVMLPLWRLIEQTTGIESIGHSGPALWCYCFAYLVCSAASLRLLKS